MLTFLHTADLQIGMTAPGVGAMAHRIQDARVGALKCVLDLAAEHKAGCVLIAGDLFETNRVSRRYVQEAARVLEEAKPLRVFILPGNHDYYGPNSVYTGQEFRNLGAHVLVCSEPKPVVVPDLDLTLYPNPCFESRSTELPMLWIRKQEGTTYHVAMLHGSVPARFGRTQEEDEYFPMDEEVLRGLGMNYIAMGHLHSMLPNPGLEPDAPFFYSGTPEPTGFGERLSGYALLVKLDGAERTVSPLPTAQFTFEDIARKVASAADLEALRAQLERLPKHDRTLLRLSVGGVVSLELRERIDALAAALGEDFAHVRLEDAGLVLEPSGADLDRFMKGGIAHTTFTLLRAKRDAAPEADRPKYNRAISLAYRAFLGH